MEQLNKCSFGEMSTLEQRELLQEKNNDKLAAVFSKTGEDSLGIDLKCIENVLCCYPNQLQDGQIELPDDFGEGSIILVSMGALRGGKIEVIAGNSDNIGEIKNPVLLSPGVIEYYESNGKKYTQTVLRYGGKMNTSTGITSLAGANERTTTAGRNFSGDLIADLEIENAEESPFLMQDEVTKQCYLVTHDLNYVPFLRASVENYLENKYLTENDENFLIVKQAFERKFTGINYEELGKILQDILDNNRIKSYNWEAGEITELDNTQIRLGDQSEDFYVYNDTANNTIEYRAIRKITGFPDGLTAVGKIPLRLFLESQNQDPSFKKIQNIGRNGTKNYTDMYTDETGKQKSKVPLVPTIRDVAEKVGATLTS